MADHLILYSSIPPILLKKTLLKGSLLAIVGALIFVFAGSFLSPLYMKQWGWTIYPGCLTLIAYGLIPYRRMSRLVLKPDQLIAKGKEDLEFFSKGEKIFRIPFSIIQDIHYIEQNTLHGIGMKLDPESIEGFIKQFPKSKKLLSTNIRIHPLDYDLFFPFFTQRSFNELKEWQAEELNSTLDDVMDVEKPQHLI